ncbi:MAG: type II secretion system protein [Clostridia bacterium]|nr:type II secretion system protein [Clostridia bacterium]
MKKNSKKGFTLIELVITIGLFSVVGVLCASLIFTGITSSRKNAEKSAFQIGVNKFIAIVNNHILSVGDGGTQITFNEADTTEVTLVANGIAETYKFKQDTKQLLLTKDSVTSIVAPSVKDAIFTYDADRKVLNIKIQSDLDDGWLETSFYLR